MNIAIFSENFYPELSGISDSIITTGRVLAQGGHAIRFYAARYPDETYQKRGVPRDDPDWGDRVSCYRMFAIPYNAPTGRSAAIVPFHPGWFFDLKRFKPDVIFTQFIMGAGMAALAGSRLLGVPLVGTSHTAISEFIRSPIAEQSLKAAGLRFESWYYNKCRFVTAPSRSVFDEMERYGFSRPHRVLSNPIADKFQPVSAAKKKELRKKYSLTGPTVVYAGRLAPEKNTDVLIRAIGFCKNDIPDIHLIIAGDGSSHDELLGLVADLELDNNFEFLGIISQDELVLRYQASDIFAITSTSETQSMVLMQALACGLPAVGVRARALPEYILPQHGYIVEPGDSEAFAQKLTTILKNPEVYSKMAKNAADFAKKFSKMAIADEWERIFNEAVGG